MCVVKTKVEAKLVCSSYILKLAMLAFSVGGPVRVAEGTRTSDKPVSLKVVLLRSHIFMHAAMIHTLGDGLSGTWLLWAMG